MGRYDFGCIIKAADILTIWNAIAGFFAIIAFFSGYIEFGLWLMILGAVLDVLDGKVARYMHSENEFGKRLDMADLITFGVAPAVLVYNIAPSALSLSAGAVLVTATLVRLARFQMIREKVTVGMPSTFNGIIFPAVYYLLPEQLLAAALISSILMVSGFERK